jgi:hypothetical protein
VFAVLAKIKIEKLEKAALRAEEERKRKDDEAKKEIPAQIERALQYIKYARSALAAKRYADAKRHTAAAKAASDQVAVRDAASPDGQALSRDVASLSKDVGDTLTAHARAQVARARQLIGASRLDEAKRILDEAVQLDDASPELAAARREYEAARAKSPTVRKPDAAVPDARRPAASLVAELRRKAEAGEKENGFCATTRWSLPNANRHKRFLDGAVGTAIVGRTGTFTCYYTLIASDGTFQGTRCIRTISWRCGWSNVCNKVTSPCAEIRGRLE